MPRYSSSRGASRSRAGSRAGGRAGSRAGGRSASRAGARGGAAQARGGRRPSSGGGNNAALIVVSILAVVGVLVLLVVVTGNEDEKKPLPPREEPAYAPPPEDEGPSELPRPEMPRRLMREGERDKERMEELYEEGNELYQEAMAAKERGASRDELDELMSTARHRLQDARAIYLEWEGKPGLPTNRDWYANRVIDDYFFGKIIVKVDKLLALVGSKASGGGSGG